MKQNPPQEAEGVLHIDRNLSAASWLIVPVYSPIRLISFRCTHYHAGVIDSFQKEEQPQSTPSVRSVNIY